MTHKALLHRVLILLDVLPKLEHSGVMDLAEQLKNDAQAEIDAPEPEPVAWMLHGHASVEMHKYVFGGQAGEVIPGQKPLYTHPTTVREPLSETELRAEFAKMYPNDDAILSLSEMNSNYRLESIGARHHWRAFERGARAIEAAHGIGAKP